MRPLRAVGRMVRRRSRSHERHRNARVVQGIWQDDALKRRALGAYLLFSGLNIPAAMLVTRRRGTRRWLCAPK